MVPKIPYSDIKFDANYLKFKWNDNKTKDIVLIKNLFFEYRQKKVPITTQKYFCGDQMEESVNDLTTQTRQQEKGVIVTNAENNMGSFIINLIGQTIEINFFHKLLPITECTKFDNMLNNENCKRTIKKGRHWFES